MFKLLSPHHAHMPFVFRHGGQVQLIYGRAIPQYRRRLGKLVTARPTAWKLQWLMPHLPAMGQIQTGLDETEDECSPTVSETKDGIQLSFIGTLLGERAKGKTLDGGVHRLFTMTGSDVDHLGPAVRVSEEECYCGFSRPDLIVFSSGVDGNAHVVGGRVKTLQTDFATLVRISYRFDEPSVLLITGTTGPRVAPQTIMMDIDTGKLLGELKIEGQSCYKPTLISGLAITPLPPYCRQGWHLSYTKNYAVSPATVTAKAV